MWAHLAGDVQAINDDPDNPICVQPRLLMIDNGYLPAAPAASASEYIRTDADVRRITEYFFEHDLPVGTVCHGPQVPAVYGLLRGRTTAA